ncbi:MAG: helix-turn-helix transcriptional regulator [Fulvivirga sp.]
MFIIVDKGEKYMKGSSIGEFEELVLLSVAINGDNAYSLSILEELKTHMKRKVLISSVHKVLVRLEEKGYLKSYMGDPVAVRGGKAKKLYELTADGKEVLEATRELRESMWSAIPQMQWTKK